MKQRLTSVIALCAVAGLATPALADCEQELAELRDASQADAGDGISKDGSLAPLETAEDDVGATEMAQSGSEAEQNDTADAEGEIVKDGDTAPLEADTSSIATSGQDAEAQQNSSDASGADGMSQEAKDAITVAEAALEAGDEKACMEAVEEARNS